MINICKWLAITVLCFIVSCAQPQTDLQGGQTTASEVEGKRSKVIDGKFVHVVLFWFKNPEDKSACIKFEKSLHSFIEQSAFVKSMHIGKPAGTDRAVVDNSYTYSLVVSFDSKEAQDKYQDEPVHKKFVEDCSDMWDRVQIYDSIHF